MEIGLFLDRIKQSGIWISEGFKKSINPKKFKIKRLAQVKALLALISSTNGVRSKEIFLKTKHLIQLLIYHVRHLKAHDLKSGYL